MMSKQPPCDDKSGPSDQTLRITASAEEIATIRQLSTLRNSRFLLDLLMQWLIIAAAVAAAVWSGEVWVYLLAFAVIASRQHALGILMHDATHYRCLRSRTLNDLASDLFCALPVNMITSRYRHEHFLHHRHVNTMKDPYWANYQAEGQLWPKTRWQAFSFLLKDAFGFNLTQRARAVANWSPWKKHFAKTFDETSALCWRERFTIYFFFGTLITVLTLVNGWFYFFALWLLPLMTLTPFLSRLRVVGEHFALPENHQGFAARTTRASLWERIFISPFHINYHTEHHLYPTVPYYNLRRLHLTLWANSDYARKALVYDSYFGKGRSLKGDMISLPVMRRGQRSLVH